MKSKPYKVFGVIVPAPPSDGGYMAGDVSEGVVVFKGQTIPMFSTGGVQFFDQNPIPVSSVPHIQYKTQNNFDDLWCCGDTHGTIALQVQSAAHIDNVVANIHYNENAENGTHEGTAASISITSGSGANADTTSVAWKMNTNEPGAWAQSPPFSLVRGLQTVTFDVYVADGNNFGIWNFDIDAPAFSPRDLIIRFYWKCIRSETVIPEGTYQLTDSFTAGVSTESDSTSSVSKELGLSASAGYKSISLGLTAAIKSTSSTSESVKLNKATTVTNSQVYPNKGDTDMTLQLWQPCVEYDIAGLKIIDQRADTLLATTQWAPKQPN